jgi:hypothetical protein
VGISSPSLEIPVPAPNEKQPSTHPDRTNPHGFSDNQVRSILVRLGYIDQLLMEIDQVTRNVDSAFSTKAADLSPAEITSFQQFVTHARSELMHTLDTLAIQRPIPDGSARWNIKTNLTFADVTLDELTPKSLRGYGDLPDDAATIISNVIQQLHQVIQKGKTLFDIPDSTTPTQP